MPEDIAKEQQATFEEKLAGAHLEWRFGGPTKKSQRKLWFLVKHILIHRYIT
jgi:hypothetical protein